MALAENNKTKLPQSYCYLEVIQIASRNCWPEEEEAASFEDVNSAIFRLFQSFVSLSLFY